jgi:23S rRNA (cytosine1962-C5)-methyltransferase
MKAHGLVLPDPVASFVREGGRDLRLSELAAGGFKEGRPLRLFDLMGRPLGLAVADPENGLVRLMAGPGEAFEALDEAFFAARVDAAAARRQALGLGGAFRLIHSAGDGLPGLAADRFGDWAVLYVYSQGLLPQGRLCARALRERLSLRGVVLKVRARGAAGRQDVRQEIVGAPPPEKLVVEESGVPFELHLGTGLNTGLFTDMREHRHRLPALAAGRAVLNGFSYTGSLSVLCARGGAASVTSVDLSAGVQRWAMDNFRLSGLDPEQPRFAFEVDDVGRWLARAVEEGRRFGLVLLDPPTWSAARGAEWSLERDYPELVRRAAQLLEPGGLLWLASNTRAIDLEAIAGRGLAASGRQAELLEKGGLGPDYPTVEAQPRDRYLQVCLHRVA